MVKQVSQLSFETTFINLVLHSLRHTYATFKLLRGGNDVHTLSKQMGNSAAMIERYDSELAATMAADMLA